MDYTRSDAFITHVATGHRMHQDTAPITSKVTASDLNSLTWELMELLNAAGVPPAAFNADVPGSYQTVLAAVSALAVAAAASAVNAIAPNLVPTGTVVQGYFVNAPTGWLMCEGQLVSRTTYAGLWGWVQAQDVVVSDVIWLATSANVGLFSAGDGSTSFRVPDLRAQFLRAADRSKGLDVGRALGSGQADALQNITGWFGADDRAVSATGDVAGNAFYNAGTGHGGVDSTAQGGDGLHLEIGFDASRVARTAAETRPRNVALAACIKT